MEEAVAFKVAAAAIDDPTMPITKRPVSLAVGTLLIAALLSACSSTGSGSRQPSLPYQPRQAPVVFIPGLVGSALACGPRDGSAASLWPPTATSTAPRFGDLALVNTVDARGHLTSRTTSSAPYPSGCGSRPDGGGSVAQYEPVTSGALWCAPAPQAMGVDPVACSSPAADQYSSFGLTMESQIEVDGRKQDFTSLPWDWRQSPTAPVARLQRLLEAVTKRAGVRATVVAHSFGNLVYREWTRWARAHGGADRLVGRFVSIAGPWWGVSTAWTHPAFGLLQPGADAEALSQYEGLDATAAVFQSAPGTYSLLPTAGFTKEVTRELGGRGWLAIPDPTGSASSWVPQSKIADAASAQFRSCPQREQFPCQVRSLVHAAQASAPAPGFVTGGVEWIGIVGSGVPTAGQICSGCTEFPGGSTDGIAGPSVPAGSAPETVWRMRPVNGDGNVAFFSAIQGTDPSTPPGDHVAFHFTCGHTHMGLVRDSDVLARVVPFLLGDSPLGSNKVFAAKPCALPNSSASP